MMAACRARLRTKTRRRAGAGHGRRCPSLARGWVRRRPDRGDYRPYRAQPFYKLCEHSSRCSGGLPRREIPPCGVMPATVAARRPGPPSLGLWRASFPDEVGSDRAKLSGVLLQTPQLVPATAKQGWRTNWLCPRASNFEGRPGLLSSQSPAARHFSHKLRPSADRAGNPARVKLNLGKLPNTARLKRPCRVSLGSRPAPSKAQAVIRSTSSVGSRRT
jgi:hypothetical protein